MNTVKRILVPTDFSESSTRAMEYARAIAERFEASLDLLHVVPNPYVSAASEVYLPPPQEFLDELVAEAQARLDSTLDPVERARFGSRNVVTVGDPLVEIVEYAGANQIDLIVMGTHGRTGIAHLVLGSVAERVVRTAPCAVLTVR